MDRISPLDLERAEFNRVFRGLDPKPVKELLAKAGKEIELLRSELQAAKGLQEASARELEGFRQQESTLKEALILAQKTADDTRATAHREAEAILAESHRQATDLQRHAQEKINDLRWELERLSLERAKVFSRLRSVLQEHLDNLDGGAGHQPPLVNLELSDAVGG